MGVGLLSAQTGRGQKPFGGGSCPLQSVGADYFRHVDDQELLRSGYF